MENQNPIVELQEWTATLTESVRRVAIQILEHLPEVLGAIVLLLAGLLILFLGLWFAEVTRAVLSRASKKTGIEQSDVPGRLGPVLRITRTSLILETQQGQTRVPA